MVDNEEDQTNRRLYKRRWAFLVSIVVSLQLLRSYSNVSTGQVSNVYVAHFNVTYEQVDWFAEVGYIVQFVISPILAWLSHSKMIHTRRVCLAATGFVATGYLCRAISLTHHDLYSLMLIGQIFQGLAITISASLPATFAVLWFPPSQVGTAIAANFVGMSIGTFMAGAIPTRVLKNPDQHAVSTKGMNKSSNYTKITVKNDISLVFKISLSIFSVVSVIFIFLAIFLTDGPPTPPSQSEDVKDKVRGNSKPDFGQFLTDTKRLICDYTFVLISLAYGLQYRVFIVEELMMSQLIRSVLHSSTSVNDYVVGGNVIMIYAASCICGAFVAGRLVDKFRGYLLMLTRIAAFLTTVSSIGIFVAYRYFSLVGLYAGVFGYGFFVRVVLVTVYQVIAQHTYPMDEIFTACWLGTLQGWLNPVIGQIARITFANWGGEKMLICVQTGGLLVGFLFTFFVKPKYKRREAEEKVLYDVVEESSPLISINEENVSQSVTANGH